jgi:hypothetical protein
MLVAVSPLVADDASSTGDTPQALTEQHAQAGNQQQPALSSGNTSSSRPAAAKPAAAAAAAKPAPAKGKPTSAIKQRKQATKQEQQGQQEQPDVAAKPDAMQALARERKRRAFIGMLK